VIDALFLARERIEQDDVLRQAFKKQFSFLSPDDRLLLVTGHRRENFGEGMRNICAAIEEIVGRFPDLKVIYPVHPNPSVRGPVAASLSNVSNVFLLDPLEYLPFVYLLSRSTIILTDSGGVQEEAPSFGKPVLVMRDHTERPEAVKVGTVKMVGTSRQKIVDGISDLLSDPVAYSQMAAAHNPYGDGLASCRIVDVIAGRRAW
jgi:UDP-N-acetylglucosamine 2-epimerase (non-hydrolysing)